jgi:GMP synthase-like glutamine amidotransferase
MRILIATDAWKPQVNGVVNTYSNLEREAANAGLDLKFLTPVHDKLSHPVSGICLGAHAHSAVLGVHVRALVS